MWNWVNTWSIDNWLTLVSIIITAVFSVMMWYVAETQKNIQEKQKNLELFNLRYEHKQEFINTLESINNIIYGHISINNSKPLGILKNTVQKLYNISRISKYLFDEEIYNLEIEIVSDIECTKDYSLCNNTKEKEVGFNERYSQSLQSLKSKYDKFLIEAKF